MEEMDTDNINEQDEDSDAAELELERQADELERSINSNKYQYDKHEQLVGLYAELEDYGSLRDAYERFHSVYPLTPTIWMNWIKAEKEIATSDESKKHILELYKQGVEDYSSVLLWLDYAQYSLGCCELTETCEIINNGIRSVGLHVQDGHLLYDMLREIEIALLSSKESGSEAWQEQLQKVVEAFKRQLSVPLDNIEETYKEFQDFIAAIPDIDAKNIDKIYKKSLATLQTYKPFEERLNKKEEPSLGVYKEYIAASKNNPSFVVCLYERAVLENCLDTGLWEDYVSFCIPLGVAALKASKKAVRNCPWHEQLWVLRLKVLEKEQCEKTQVVSTFEEGLQSIQPSIGEEIWLAFMEYAIRTYEGTDKVEAIFNQANEFVDHSASALKLVDLQGRYWANNGNFQKAKEIWNKYLVYPATESYNMWKEYISLHLRYGTVQNIQSMFKLAKQKVKDYPLQVVEDWLMFEREKGTLDSLLACLKIRNELIPKTATQTSEIVQNTAELEIEDKKYRRRQYEDRDTTREERHVNRKRSSEDKDYHKEDNAKRRRFGEAREHKPKMKHPDRVLTAPADINPDLTIFISNLSPDNFEEDLSKMFPNADKIHIVIDRKGISRRFAYVRFKSNEEVVAALKRDREPLDGKPIFISQCQVDKAKRENKLKYSNTTEKNKLFVKNLPFSLTNEEFEAIYKPFKAVSCRLIYHKNGNSKGFGYVEFSSEADAEKALKDTNGTKVHDMEIVVAISAPPPRKANDEFASFPTRNARTKLQTSFVPRGVQLQQQKNEKKEANGSEAAKPKSNNDFRKMFLNN